MNASAQVNITLVFTMHVQNDQFQQICACVHARQGLGVSMG